MDEVDLNAKCDAVVDRETFFEFVAALVAHRKAAARAEASSASSPYGPDAGGWENGTIEGYLEACAAWARDAGEPMEPSWQSFARMLRAGVAYE